MCSKSIICSNCKREVAEDSTACPYCGNTTKIIKLFVEETFDLGLVDRAKIKLKDHINGKSKHNNIVTETNVGSIYSKDKGKNVSLMRCINRKDDLYHEKVVDPDTGETIHECDESLSEHVGHGSAKFKKW